MTDTKKFTILNKIENDAPFGNINFCTISFLTANKAEKTKYLDIYGFKVHDGYNTYELCDQDAVKIKNKNKNHDVYLAEMGKIYAWDDATKSDSLQYGDPKLNNLEKTRRENVDKIKMMAEQNQNNYTPAPTKAKNRQEATLQRLQKQLYSKGKITTYEWEAINKRNKPVNQIKAEAAAKEVMEKEMIKVNEVDYLDENESTGLKFGCITIYSPEKIRGLSEMYLKVRGLFQTVEEARERAMKLGKLYKEDQIHIFEIGKWCAFSIQADIDATVQLARLNYAMKCYLDNLSIEADEFEKRKEALISKNEKETAANQAKNVDEKKKKRNKNKNKDKDVHPTENKNKFTSTGNQEDDANIQSLMDYLADPELDEIMASKQAPKNDSDRVEINV
jgi:hypothetical protein